MRAPRKQQKPAPLRNNPSGPRGLVSGKLLGLFWMFVAAAASGAEGDEVEKSRFAQFTFENDIFFHSDRYYTDGFQIMWGKKEGEANLLSRPLERLLCSEDKCPDSRRALYSQKVGQLIYTPVLVTVAAPQPNDRPWAAFLYYGAESLFVDADPTLTRSIGYQVGMVGPAALGEQVQNGVHHFSDSDRAGGWDNQLDNEPGIVVTYMVEKRVLRLDARFAHSAIWLSGGGGVGNVATFAGVGAKLAFGRNLPLQINPSQIGPKSLPLTERALVTTENAGRYGSCLRVFSACYVFVGMDARYIAHNIFLDGNTFQGNNGNIERTPFVYDLVAGVTLAFGPQTFMDGWYLNFARTRRSSEFSSPAGDGAVQRFGSITLGREY